MHVSLRDVRVEVEHGEDALAHVTECSLAFVPSLFKWLAFVCLCQCYQPPLLSVACLFMCMCVFMEP